MIVAELISTLSAAGISIATCESCTGGGLARRITGVSGASSIFWGGWITYDNTAKTTLLGVPPQLLERHGAVSPEVATAMAEGGLARMNSVSTATGGGRVRICVATTGIAGPSGGSDAKPIGLCFVAVAATARPTVTIEVRNPPSLDRATQQRLFEDAAFQALAKVAVSFS